MKSFGVLNLVVINTVLTTISVTVETVELWKVSQPNNSTNFKELLKPFNPIYRAWGSDSLSYSDIHGVSLAVHYAKGSYSRTKHRGGGFYSTPAILDNKNLTNVILMYDVYFDNFGWGVMGKLPGLFGGVKGDGAYLCSGGRNPTECFSLRVTWRSPAEAELYAYISTDQGPGFVERTDVIKQYPFGLSFGRGKRVLFKNQEWQTVMEEVHLNSNPDKPDGWVKVCVLYKDNTKDCFSAEQLVIRKSMDHYIRGMVFSSFFGGSKPYTAAPNDCHAYFRNFKIVNPEEYVPPVIG